MNTTKPISEQLRDQMKASSLLPSELSKQTGIPESSLSRFLNGKAGLLLGSIDALGIALNTELVTNHNHNEIGESFNG